MSACCVREVGGRGRGGREVEDGGGCSIMHVHLSLRIREGLFATTF